MRYFPIFLDLQDKRVLIAGGGETALQKLRLLLKTTARIAIVAKEIEPELATLARTNGVAILERPFAPSDLDGAALVFAAAADSAVDAAVARAAKARSIPVNVVDGPAESSFIMPALVDRSPVVVAVGSEGAAPVLARDLRARIEAMLPAGFGEVAASAGALRARVQAAVTDPRSRRRLWERLLTGVWRRRILAGDRAGAGEALELEITAARDCLLQPGHVTLIGCGPGDPDLLTLRAQARLQEADVLVVDRLVHPSVLEHARRDARRLDVGKEPDGKSTAQAAINRLLIAEALKGNRVARLKGGDAFIFGRAAEEMAALRTAGIEVEVVPGLTAAHACAAAIGLPLTLRERVRQFSVLTGATADGASDLYWQALARPGHALAIYMGVGAAPVLSRKLLRAGAAPNTPVVIVENGTRPEQRVVATTLDLLAAAMRAKRIKPPAILFVGLSWEQAGLSRPANIECFAATIAERQLLGSEWASAEIAGAPQQMAG